MTEVVIGVIEYNNKRYDISRGIKNNLKNLDTKNSRIKNSKYQDEESDDTGYIDPNYNDSYYKPKAGDVLVFPAGDPNYLSEPGELYRHGVRKTYGKPKYFIRNHWQRFYEGSEEWLKQEQIYGKDAWAEIERGRIKEGINSGAYQPLDYAKISETAERIQ